MAITYKAGSAESREFNVPPGQYTLRVIEAKEDTSKNGNDMVVLKLRVIRDDGAEGPALFDRLVAIPTASWKIDQFLAACGHAPQEGEEVSLDVDEMIGWECQAELGIRTYEGKKSNEVTNYLLPDPGF